MKRVDGNTSNPSKKAERMLLIDSSLLMLPISGKRKGPINIEAALFEVSEGMKLCVLESTIEELKILKEKKIGKKRLAADFALQLIEKMKLCVVPIPNDVRKYIDAKKSELRGWEVADEILAIMAKKLKAAVATTDLELRDKLRKDGVPVLYLRGRKWVYFDPAAP